MKITVEAHFSVADFNIEDAFIVRKVVTLDFLFWEYKKHIARIMDFKNRRHKVDILYVALILIVCMMAKLPCIEAIEGFDEDTTTKRPV